MSDFMIVPSEPQGSSGQIQYNNGGAFGGVSAFSWNGTIFTLTARMEMSIGSGGGTIAIGASAGSAITSGARNVLIGSFAGAAITTQSQNIAIGGDALRYNSTASGHVAIGNGAMADDRWHVLRGDRRECASQRDEPDKYNRHWPRRATKSNNWR